MEGLWRGCGGTAHPSHPTDPVQKPPRTRVCKTPSSSDYHQVRPLLLSLPPFLPPSRFPRAPNLHPQHPNPQHPTPLQIPASRIAALTLHPTPLSQIPTPHSQQRPRAHMHSSIFRTHSASPSLAMRELKEKWCGCRGWIPAAEVKRRFGSPGEISMDDTHCAVRMDCRSREC